MTDNAPVGKWVFEGQRCIMCGEEDPALLLDGPVTGDETYPEGSDGVWWQNWLRLEPGDAVNICVECVNK